MTQPTRQTPAGRFWRVLVVIAMLAATEAGVLSADTASPGNSSAGSLGSRLIVQLAAPSLVEAGYYDVASEPAAGQSPRALWPTAEDYRQHLQAEQLSLAKQLTSAVPGAVVEHEYQVTFNGLAVRLPQDSASARTLVESLDAVARVYEEDFYSPTLYTSLDDLAVGGLWDSVGGASKAGTGVKIAILDSGIQTSHPMLSAAGLTYPTGYPKGDLRDTSAKVIVARVYVRPGVTPLPGEDRPAPGARGSPHGTHVGGIAAGSPVVVNYLGVQQSISGVAPRAWLMNYRIFYPTASDVTMAYEAEILRAVEDAVLDGADVLCCSWTSSLPRAPEASALGQALTNAVAAGKVVVAGSGNEGPGYGSASQVPGALEPVITVGAVSKSGEIVANLVDVLGPQPLPSGMTAQPFEPALFGGAWQGVLGPLAVVDARQADPGGSALGCGSLSAAVVSGKVVVVARGDCAFADKAWHAQQAGAAAVLIVNDSDELAPMSCVGQYCGSGIISIPVAMVTQFFGQRLADWAASHPDATLSLDATGRLLARTAGTVEDYSGRGPAHLRHLKPDLVAPGRAVLSAWFNAASQPGYTQVSGTSMAVAHIAGAAAVLRQRQPTWTPAEIKSALVNTARAEAITLPESSARATSLDRGAGLANLGAAVATPLLLSPASLSLGQVDAGGAYEVTLSLKDARTSGSALTYNVLPSTQVGLTIVPSASTVTLGPGQRATLGVTAYVSGGSESGELTGELVLVSGTRRLSVPVWLHVLPAAEIAQVLVIDNDFSFYGAYRDYSPFITAALDALGVSYRVWDADARYNQEQTLPAVGYLQAFDAVIWLTGDNTRPDGYYVVPTPLTRQDQAVLQAYLDGGGRLLSMGQNLAEASDINPSVDPEWGRSALLHSYLGAHWLQGSLFDPGYHGILPPSSQASVVGWPDSGFVGLRLDLGAVGDGARDQLSVDEIAPGGWLDGSDADLVQPLLMATAGFPLGAGCVAVGKLGDPTLERRELAIPYRSLYFSFGLQGVNNNPGSTSRAEVLQRSLDWLLDELSITLEPQIVAVNDAAEVLCSAETMSGYPVKQYRWALTDSSGTSEVVTNLPTLTVLYQQPGVYDLAVEATDLLGHRAVAQTEVVASYLGESTLTVTPSAASPLGELVFRAVLRNSSGADVASSFNLPLPAGTEYVSHSGGSFSDGVYRWSGTLAGQGTQLLQLRVRVKSSAPSGAAISATGTFTASGVSFSRRASALVHVPVYIPFVRR